MIYIKVSVYYTSFSANNSFMEYFVYFLSHKLFGIERYLFSQNKATSGLLDEIEVSYIPVHSYNILVIIRRLGLG